MTPGLLGALAALAVTIGLMILVLRLFTRLQQAGGGRGVPLQVLQRVMLAPRQGIALVRIGDRVLVVSLAETGVNMLTELTDEARTAALAPGDAPPRLPGGLRLPFLKLALIACLAMPLLTPAIAQAARAATPATPTLSVPAPAPPQVDIRLGEGRDGLHLSGAVGLVVFLGVLTLLPALFLLMTSFTRILIVLHFLRSALGTQTTPPNQLLVAIAVLLTGVVMHPVLQQAQADAVQPFLDGRITQAQAYHQALHPFREFMLANTRAQDLGLFAELSGIGQVDSTSQLPTVTVVSAFMTSELRTAFQMGFVIFLPFIVVDVIVASVLMSLGMFMLPPVMISLPFKLLLFVLADGWTLVVRNLVASFR